mmetsp:Transcript_6458/g.17792  ORF Transcript_6458/g.17792 Transcript_6458/m.17792 type:complete len:494 (-) Transcript_6458:201-1682(-)
MLRRVRGRGPPHSSHPPVALPGRVLDDVVHPDDHLGGLRSGAELRHLTPEGLHDAQRVHVGHHGLREVNAHRGLPLRVHRLQLADEVLRVVARVVRQDHRQLLERLREGLHRRVLLAIYGLGPLEDAGGHGHLGGAPAVDDARVLHRLVEHSQGVVQRPLRLVQDVAGRAAQHDGAGLVLGAPRELDHLVLADHDLGNLLAGPQPRLLGVVEGRHNVRAQDGGQALRAVEVGVLDGHDAGLFEQLLRVVVDELAVDEDVDAVVDDLLALGAHLVLLGLLDGGHLGHAVDLDAAAEDLDLVRVHARVGHHDLGALDALGLAHADALLQQVALLQEGVGELAAAHLEDLDALQVEAALDARHRVHGQLGEELLLVEDQLGGERRARDVHQVLAEGHRVGGVVHGGGLERLARHLLRLAPARHDGHRVDAHGNQLLRLAQQLAAQHRHARRAVAHLVVLGLGDVDEHLGGGVVDLDRLQDGGAVVGHCHALAAPRG